MPDDLAENCFVSISTPRSRNASITSRSSFDLSTSEFASTTSNYLQMLNAKSKDVLKKRLALKIPTNVVESESLNEANHAYNDVTKK
jgi:hypothetical protein